VRGRTRRGSERNGFSKGTAGNGGADHRPADQLSPNQHRQKTEPDEHGALKWALFREAADADIVLDLHCDFEAVMHLYVAAQRRPDARDLAAAIGARVTLLSGDSGGDSFDESAARIWWQLLSGKRSAPLREEPYVAVAASESA